MPSYDQLKKMQLTGEPITASYSVREGEAARVRNPEVMRANT